VGWRWKRKRQPGGLALETKTPAGWAGAGNENASRVGWRRDICTKMRDRAQVL
jgi:hypothetical protein